MKKKMIRYITLMSLVLMVCLFPISPTFSRPVLQKNGDVEGGGVISLCGVTHNIAGGGAQSSGNLSLGVNANNVNFGVFLDDIVKAPSGALYILQGSKVFKVVTAFLEGSGSSSPYYEAISDVISDLHTGFAGSRLALDKQGNIYLGLVGEIVKIDPLPPHNITVLAGNAKPGYGGDGGPAKAALVGTYSHVAVSPVGEVFFADIGNHRIRKIDLNQTITTIAGTGTPGFSGDGGDPLQANLDEPSSLKFDHQGNLLFIDDFKRIRKIDLKNNRIDSVAGGGANENSVCNLPAPGAAVSLKQVDFSMGPNDSVPLQYLAIDSQDNLFVSGSFDEILRIHPTTGMITPVVTEKETCHPESAGNAHYLASRLATDSKGNLYFSQMSGAGQRVSKLSCAASTESKMITTPDINPARMAEDANPVVLPDPTRE